MEYSPTSSHRSRQLNRNEHQEQATDDNVQCRRRRISCEVAVEIRELRESLIGCAQTGEGVAHRLELAGGVRRKHEPEDNGRDAECYQGEQRRPKKRRPSVKRDCPTRNGALS